MRSKSFIGLIIIAIVGMVMYLLADIVGAVVDHGSATFKAWRGEHAVVFIFIWLGSTIVAVMPVLWVAGRRLMSSVAAHEQAVAAGKGVGRLTVQALRGVTAASDKLVTLLKDPTPQVRYQAARALAMLDDPDINPTLFKVVRYWEVPDKLALIESLRSTHDMRCGKLVRELAQDRSLHVSRKASDALPVIMGRAWRGVINPDESGSAARRMPIRVAKSAVTRQALRRAAEGEETTELAAVKPSPKPAGADRPVRRTRPASEGVAAAPGEESPAKRRVAPSARRVGPAVKTASASEASRPSTTRAQKPVRRTKPKPESVAPVQETKPAPVVESGSPAAEQGTV